MIMLVSTVHVVNDYAGVHVVNDYAGVHVQSLTTRTRWPSIGIDYANTTMTTPTY